MWSSSLNAGLRHQVWLLCNLTYKWRSAVCSWSTQYYCGWKELENVCWFNPTWQNQSDLPTYFLSWCSQNVQILNVHLKWLFFLIFCWAGRSIWEDDVYDATFLLGMNREEATHSSRMRMTSALFSKTSCRVMMLGWWISFRMFTSRSMSSLVTPRRLDLLRRFLMNLAANSTPVPLCRHLLTTANWPLAEEDGRGGRREEGGGVNDGGREAQRERDKCTWRGIRYLAHDTIRL